jgi:hypothetical protein
LVVDGDDQRAHLDDAVYALTAVPPCGVPDVSLSC